MKTRPEESILAPGRPTNRNLLALDEGMIYVILTVAAFLVPASLRLAGWSEAVAWMLSEDSIYEVVGATFCLVGGIVFLAAGAQRKSSARGPAAPLHAAWCMLFGIGLLGLFLEEISWGQRLFGFESNETIQRLNAQGEYNLHNLRVFQDGYSSNWLYLALLGAMTAYLIILPILCRWIPLVARGMQVMHFPVPSLGLAAGTATGIFFLVIAEPLRSGMDWLTVQEASEVLETLIEGCLCSLAVTNYRNIPTDRRRVSSGRLIILASAFAIPYCLLAVVHLKDVSIEARSAEQASIFVFAGRQELAAGDLKRAEARFADALLIWNHPQTLAQIALAYAQTGHSERADRILDEAIAREPDTASLHAARGLVLAVTGRADQALAAFENAVRLDPNDLDSRENLEKLRAAFRNSPTAPPTP